MIAAISSASASKSATTTSLILAVKSVINFQAVVSICARISLASVRRAESIIVESALRATPFQVVKVANPAKVPFNSATVKRLTLLSALAESTSAAIALTSSIHASSSNT